MALEIARLVPNAKDLLDVGCGNGFIVHHLRALLSANITGIDLMNRTEATIAYRRYDGTNFPLMDGSVDVVLLCYVLHHAQDVSGLLQEIKRVLRAGGYVVIYEDIPQCWWDRAVCFIHNHQWQERTGPCEFRLESEWRALFNSLGFKVIGARPLSRSRNFTHPVSRALFVLRR
jgi:SAM-dependent methyltransferase